LDRPTSARLTALRLLPLLCVVLPLIAYVSVGSYRFRQLRVETEVRLDRALRIATEHALKVMDTSESLLSRVQDRAVGPSTQLAQNEAALHAQLRAMAQNKPQLQGIWIFGPEGRPLASSRLHPVPAVDIRDRDYFRHHQEWRGGLYLSELLVARSTGEAIFDVSLRRAEPDGQFGGVLSVSLLAAYFERFHSDLAADEPGLAITMLRDDGVIFSRWPKLAATPRRLAPNSPVMSRIRQGMVAGTAHGVSSVDGRERLLAFRKVGDYPIYLGTGMDTLEIRKRWLDEMGWLAAFGLPPVVGLYLVARVALRRSREAIDAAERLHRETEARQRVEEALLQSQKLEALGRLTGGVAHDFNNALMVISNNLVLLKMKHPEAAGSIADSMGRAVSSATKLTRQLLAFSRRQALVPERMVLQERLPLLKDLLLPVLGSQVRLAVTVEPDTRPIRVDPAEFELAVLNLAINARDALGQNGRFELVAGNAPEPLPPLLSAPMVRVRAIDNGSGIAPEVLAKVFEPFFTTKPMGQGTGLGLSQVYGLCQRAGGTATVESQPGQGTTVSLFFPAYDGPPGESGPAAQVARRHLGKRLLVVEDNADVAAGLVPLLEAMGCTVTHVDRAAAARDWLATQPQLPDLLLTDVVMPGEMDGAALAILARERWPQLKVILMTGYAEQLDSLARMGFEILPKPCTPEVLAEAIERVARR
jgi:signal transduction histidine kinase